MGVLWGKSGMYGWTDGDGCMQGCKQFAVVSQRSGRKVVGIGIGIGAVDEWMWRCGDVGLRMLYNVGVWF